MGESTEFAAEPRRPPPVPMHVAIGAGFGSAIGGASRKSQHARFNPACAGPRKVRIVFPAASAMVIGTPMYASRAGEECKSPQRPLEGFGLPKKFAVSEPELAVVKNLVMNRRDRE